MLQPEATERPVITKRSCTPPSGEPSGLRMNRASLTGPFAVMNGGILFIAPSAVAIAICGFDAGLEPPTAGNAWQPLQLVALNRGPRPFPASFVICPETESTSWNRARAALKKFW